MDNLGRIVNAGMAIGLWVLAIFFAMAGFTLHVGAETIYQQQLGALWVIVGMVCLVGGCIVFSRQCVGK